MSMFPLHAIEKVSISLFSYCIYFISEQKNRQTKLSFTERKETERSKFKKIPFAFSYFCLNPHDDLSLVHRSLSSRVGVARPSPKGLITHSNQSGHIWLSYLISISYLSLGMGVQTTPKKQKLKLGFVHVTKHFLGILSMEIFYENFVD